ncbi:hypothetical protein ABKV41_21220 [Enterobacter roggenkampii]|uniref:hypothetical protein n=1 Tax=Enterobacter roggenkampii TaxID=1812935 RepID=UPI0032AF82AA
MRAITKEFTKEQLQQIEAAAKEVMWPVVWSEKKAREHFSEKITPKVVLKLARIALASLEAEPAIHRWRRVTSEPYGPYPWHYGDFIGFSKPVDGIEDEYFYSAPPAPAPVSDEDKVLAEQARAVIHCLDMCGVPSGDYADNEQLQLWGRVIEYGRHPASVSVPDGYRLQPISEYDAMCAAMLQGAEPVTTACKLPELTDSQCLEFLAVAFRHSSIKGDIEFDDIRLGLKMALEAAPKQEVKP